MQKAVINLVFDGFFVCGTRKKIAKKNRKILKKSDFTY